MTGANSPRGPAFNPTGSALPQHHDRKRNRHRAAAPEPALPNPFTPYSTLTATEVPCPSDEEDEEDASPETAARDPHNRSLSPDSSPSGEIGTHHARNTRRRTLPHLHYHPASTLITIDEVDSGLSSAGGSATPGTSVYGSVPGTITLGSGSGGAGSSGLSIVDGEFFRLPHAHPGAARRRSSLCCDAERGGAGEGAESDVEGDRSASLSLSGSGSVHLRPDGDMTDDEDADSLERHRRSAAPSAASRASPRARSPALSGTERSPLLSAQRSRSIRSGRSGRSARSGSVVSVNEPTDPQSKWHQTPLVVAGFKLGLLFLLFTAVLGGTLWLGVPRLDRWVWCSVSSRPGWS